MLCGWRATVGECDCWLTPDHREWPPVIGPKKRSTAMRRSRSSCWKHAVGMTTKRSRSEAGSRACSTGGIKRARAVCQNGVAVNVSLHHRRQRAMVRGGTGTISPRRSRRDALAPDCRMAISTTMAATYTRRPRKRSDGGVARDRHPCRRQQNEKRWSCSGPSFSGRPRGLRLKCDTSSLAPQLAQHWCCRSVARS